MNKHRSQLVIIPLLSILILSGCNKEDIIQPKSCFSADVSEANVGEPVTFTNCGEGMAFSLWTGDSFHSYSNYGTDGGTSFEGETYIYAYPEPGQFSVAVVATSYGNDGTEVYEDVDSLTITITDARAEIIEFGFRSPKVIGTVEGRTLKAEVPYGTNFSALKATFKTSSKFSVVTVDGVEQRSGKTANDFTNPVEFVVTAQTGDTARYLALVFSIPDTAKQITEFSINNIPGTFTGDEIQVTLPAGNSDLSNLSAKFETSSDKAVVTIDGTLQISGSTRNDFSGPLIYTVTAEDGSVNTYTVVVEEEIGFISYGFEQLVPAVYATIEDYNLTISVLNGTPLDSLYASFTTTDHNPLVKIGDVVQVSGITLNDFSTPLSYTLEAGGKSVQYTVKVSVIK
ncbi:MAG: hypothetical protein ABFS28_09175 [Bacteroidota bacterium]